MTTTFHSAVAAVSWSHNNLILTHGQTQILVTAAHVQNLRLQNDQSAFEDYFWNKAMENRKARRVVEAWARKDQQFVEKLYKEICS